MRHYLLSPISYLLSPISYLLSPISYLLSPISYTLSSSFAKATEDGPICRSCAAPRRKNGFTLIEVLVAISILLVAVVMASMVFQQTTGAFQSGARRVDSQVVLRNILGTITRDLAQAVVPTNYPGLEDCNDFPETGSSSGSIKFIATTGTPGKNLDGEDDKDVRTIQIIGYSKGASGVITRDVQSTTYDGSTGKWKAKGGNKKTTLNDASDHLQSVNLSFTSEGDDDDDLPERIVIRASISTSTKVGAVGAWSYGPDGEPDTDDDIHVGYQP